MAAQHAIVARVTQTYAHVKAREKIGSWLLQFKADYAQITCLALTSTF